MTGVPDVDPRARQMLTAERGMVDWTKPEVLA